MMSRQRHLKNTLFYLEKSLSWSNFWCTKREGGRDKMKCKRIIASLTSHRIRNVIKKSGECWYSSYVNRCIVCAFLCWGRESCALKYYKYFNEICLFYECTTLFLLLLPLLCAQHSAMLQFWSFYVCEVLDDLELSLSLSRCYFEYVHTHTHTHIPRATSGGWIALRSE